MLRSLKDLRRYRTEATDGAGGYVQDFYFDDAAWTVRYVVVKTGTWLLGRQVLISPRRAVVPDGQNRTLPLRLTRGEIQNSPDVSTDLPVSRQREAELTKYYSWAPYCMDMHSPPMAINAVPPPEDDAPSEGIGDAHLRSIHEVIGYHLHASDGLIGHVHDFIADVSSWVIRYLIVDTGDWVPGRHVMIAPNWVSRVSWKDRAVFVASTRKQVKECPLFDPAQPINADHEERIYHHHRRKPYWDANPR